MSMWTNPIFFWNNIFKMSSIFKQNSFLFSCLNQCETFMIHMRKEIVLSTSALNLKQKIMEMWDFFWWGTLSLTFYYYTKIEANFTMDNIYFCEILRIHWKGSHQDIMFFVFVVFPHYLGKSIIHVAKTVKDFVTW